jgi:steroid delta-isomerase-like uncharacterized protein
MRGISSPASHAMTREQIVELFEERQAALNRLDPVGIAALHSDDCVLESAMAGTVSGRHALEDFYQNLFTSFPDFKYEPEELIIDGDRVVQTASFGGTDVGGFMGLPPTGKQVRVPAVLIFTLRDRRIVRLRSVYDFTLMLVQIGVLKVKPT